MSMEVDAKTLFELKKLHGKKSMYSLVDVLVEEYEKSIKYPYKIKANSGNIILNEDGKHHMEYDVSNFTTKE